MGGVMELRCSGGCTDCGVHGGPHRVPSPQIRAGTLLRPGRPLAGAGVGAAQAWAMGAIAVGGNMEEEGGAGAGTQ